MATKLIEMIISADKVREVKVYWNSYEQEYTVKFYQDGKYLTEADYFTDDREDAVVTARS